jgi:hypothetical protein
LLASPRRCGASRAWRRWRQSLQRWVADCWAAAVLQGCGLLVLAGTSSVLAGTLLPASHPYKFFCYDWCLPCRPRQCPTLRGWTNWRRGLLTPVTGWPAHRCAAIASGAQNWRLLWQLVASDCCCISDGLLHNTTQFRGLLACPCRPSWMTRVAATTKRSRPLPTRPTACQVGGWVGVFKCMHSAAEGGTVPSCLDACSQACPG